MESSFLTQSTMSEKWVPLAIKPLSPMEAESLRALQERGFLVPECEQCGEPRRRKHRYCSEACRKAGYRARKESRPELRRVCRRCGDVFFTHDPRRAHCTYEDAESDCQDAYNAAGFVKEESVAVPCAVCGLAVGGASTGRTRRYCSRACQQRAYRQRRRGRENDDANAE